MHIGVFYRLGGERATHFKAFNSSYKKWQKGYSGLIFYHTLKGKFSNGWSFANGEVVKSITPIEDSEIDLQLHAPSAVKSLTTSQCIDHYYTVWTQQCTEWYTNMEDSEHHNGTTCGGKELTGYEYAYTQCSSSGGTGGYTGGGGGSTGGGNSLYNLFKKNNLTDEEIKILNQKYDEMLKECVYISIDNEIKHGDLKLRDIIVDPQIPNVAAINSQGNFIVKDPLTTPVSSFKHEWIHFYQREINSLTTFVEEKGMMEYENAVFKDIETYKKGSADNQKLYDKPAEYYSWIIRLEQQKIEGYPQTIADYIKWISKLNTGEVDLTLPAEIATSKKWANLFGQYSNYPTTKGYKYDGVNYPLTVLSNLIKLSNTCHK